MIKDILANLEKRSKYIMKVILQHDINSNTSHILNKDCPVPQATMYLLENTANALLIFNCVHSTIVGDNMKAL